MGNLIESSAERRVRARQEGMLVLSRACWLAVLVAVISTSAVSKDTASLDDGILDDFSVERLQEPGMDGSIYHEDDRHMAPEDVDRARKVYDVLFGTENNDAQLGEGADETAHAVAEKKLSKARKARKAATKALLKAKTSAATKKAEKALKKVRKD